MKAIRYESLFWVWLAGALALLAGSMFAACGEEEVDSDAGDPASGAPDSGTGGMPEDGGGEADAAANTETATVTVRWWGQACFTVTSEEEGGATVLTDPFSESPGFNYAFPDLEPDVCLVSHDHGDHNAVDRVAGAPAVFRGAGEHQAADLTFIGVATFHDEQEGAARGDNLVFVWEMAGMRFCHLGDLGHVLTEDQVQAIGEVDVLMAPVGGIFTIDAAKAVQVGQQLHARIFIPMHYRTDAIAIPLASVDDFLQSVPAEWTIEQPGESSVALGAAELPADGTRVVVLGYE